MPSPSPPAEWPTLPTAAANGLVTLAEAAQILGVHYMTAYRYVRTGRLAARQRGGRWQVSLTELDAFRSGLAPSPTGGTVQGGGVRATGRSAVLLAERLIAGDEAGSWRIVDDARAAGVDLDEIYLEVIGASLREVGDRWASGHATVADEHTASVVAMRVIGRLGPSAARRGRSRGTVVVAAAPGDRHGLPCALLADLLRRRGLRVVDLGADTPPEDVAAAASAEDRLVGVGLCATTPLRAASTGVLSEAVRLVHEATAAPVLVGGAGAQAAGAAGRTGADAAAFDATEALEWFESAATGSSPEGWSSR